MSIQETNEVLLQIENIESKDPLNLDDFLTEELPSLNSSGNVDKILEASESASTQLISKLPLMNNENVFASARDIGFLSASLARHGLDIEADAPMTTQAMTFISLKTQEPPRDTVYSYALRNPSDDRRRTFTGSNEENLFIDATKSGINSTFRCFHNLSRSRQMLDFDLDAATQLEQANTDFDEMVESFVNVRKNISPEYFTNELRPYFPPITIEGQTYYAPGGAQMPVLLLDAAIWGSDVNDANYLNYLRDNSIYLPKEAKAQLIKMIGQESIVSIIERTENTVAAEKMLYIANNLLRFRMPHIKTAQENMKVRERKAKGSGGYDTDVLETLIEHTRETKHRLSKVISK